MTPGVIGDLVVFEAEFYGALAEEVAQRSALFNEASSGAVTLATRLLRGQIDRTSFWKDIPNLVSRRDRTSTSAASILKLEQGENVGVKVARKVGPVQNTGDGFRALGQSPAEMSRVLGQMVAPRMLTEMVNTSIVAAEAAITAVTELNVDVSADGTGLMTTRSLNRAMWALGDAGMDVRAIVMHSKPFADLIDANLATNVTGLTDYITVYGPMPQTLGRPVVVIDSPALYDANASGSADDRYNTLLLTANAVTVQESEERDVLLDRIPGLENIVYSFQSEHAYNLNVRGMAWSTLAGDRNPADATLGNSAKWTQAATSFKHTAGVRLVTK